MTNLSWPPKDREEMLAWQEAHGTDVRIADALELTPPTIWYQRRRFAVPAMPRPERKKLEIATRPEKDSRWPECRCEQLRALWAKGLPASKIAAEMRNGLTRNAIIGKARRLGLPPRKSPIVHLPDGPRDTYGARRNRNDEQAMREHPILNFPNADLLDWSKPYLTDETEKEAA